MLDGSVGGWGDEVWIGMKFYIQCRCETHMSHNVPYVNDKFLDEDHHSQTKIKKGNYVIIYSFTKHEPKQPWYFLYTYKGQFHNYKIPQEKKLILYFRIMAMNIQIE